MNDPFAINREFEAELCRYCGSQFAVLTNSCTMALRLCLDWERFRKRDTPPPRFVECVKRTYVSVPMQIKAAGFDILFRDEKWQGSYLLKPFSIWDSARWFTSNLFNLLPWVENTPVDMPDKFVCVSFHSTKTLGIKRFVNAMEDRDGYTLHSSGWDIEQGGAILHNSPEADAWFRRARFDGRTEGVAPKDDHFDMIGHHCYMSPATARLGLKLLRKLPPHNAPLANDDYPDLSLHPVFQR